MSHHPPLCIIHHHKQYYQINWARGTKPFLYWSGYVKSLFHNTAICEKKDIRGAIWIIVSSSFTDSGYIFDWVVSIIVGIHNCRSICVRKRDKIVSQTTYVSIGVHLNNSNSTSMLFRNFICFSGYLFRQDVPGLEVVARPQKCLFVSAAHYGLYGSSNITHLWHIFINNKLCR